MQAKNIRVHSPEAKEAISTLEAGLTLLANRLRLVAKSAEGTDTKGQPAKLSSFWREQTETIPSVLQNQKQQEARLVIRQTGGEARALCTVACAILCTQCGLVPLSLGLCRSAYR